MVKVGILGAAGYTGGELIRLLLNHPDVEIVFANSESNAGNLISDVHEGLLGETEQRFTAEMPFDQVDVVFFCFGHGKSEAFLKEHTIPENVKIIDLAQDFRIKGNHDYVYGLPEIHKEEIAKCQHLANPGCFATCIQLGLLPLAKAGLLTKDIAVNAITGSTGAGQKPGATTHFSWRNNNFSVYKLFTHQHLHEICQTLNELKPEGVPHVVDTLNEGFEAEGITVDFIPYRGDFARGIFCGDEASYPAKVSWGWEEDPSTPVVTSMAEYGKGLHNVAYLRGNHLTLEADPKFQDSQYATTTSSPYTLILKDKGEDVTYPLVKINDYVYTRSLYRARSYQNGATQMSDMVPYDVNSQNAFSVYSRYADATKNVDWYMVSNYTNSLHRWGGFAPQGWTVPYAGQYRKMLQNLADITGNKPDGTIGASFLTNGVYGFNTRATGFIGVGANVADNGKFERCVLANDKMLYLGAINDADKAKLDGTENTYGGRADLQTVYTCDALSIETATGNAAMTYFLDQPISYLDGHQIANSFFYPESIREKGEWNSYRDTKNVIEHAIWNNKNAKFDCAGYKLCFPVIICQRVVK